MPEQQRNDISGKVPNNTDFNNHSADDNPLKKLAIDKDKDYIAIPIDSLRIDTVTEFDIYLQNQQSGKYVLYRRGDLPFNEEHRTKLNQSRVKAIHIDAADRFRYLRYLENNLGEIIDDDRLSNLERSKIVYDCATHLAQEIFEKPWIKKSLKRAHGIVNNTVTHLLKNPAHLTSLINLMSADYRVYSHSVNVCVYGIALGQSVGLDTWELRELGAGLLMHDLGKSEIDPNILRKGDRLTEEEWKILQTHPRLGVDILKRFPDPKPSTIDIIHQHHENCAGTGYPHGLKAERIHPYAKITSLVDTFDNLTTNKSYRKALNSFAAIRLMQDQMQHYFSPDLLKTLVVRLSEEGSKNFVIDPSSDHLRKSLKLPARRRIA
ncbi:MAG: HD domain-containing protein [Candidatus Eisenbacteria bacterium]|uniref:HD domain-containing protein n=1 Tax=Eiseniibacteriota bacterium TaxID=2212470 RepID=A0A948RWE6_UNCEI|nr:HD domain-containing protein [Candidatus Eisenbacteria bacterium]MBU1947510.1 HD domain-containing protein [Candidatus Eisenbacteria bacterium]MBU2691731.1 HD domain-containing protein [Candidatus Eisenbacteria bacterium]